LDKLSINQEQGEQSMNLVLQKVANESIQRQSIFQAKITILQYEAKFWQFLYQIELALEQRFANEKPSPSPLQVNSLAIASNQPIVSPIPSSLNEEDARFKEKIESLKKENSSLEEILED